MGGRIGLLRRRRDEVTAAADDAEHARKRHAWKLKLAEAAATLFVAALGLFFASYLVYRVWRPTSHPVAASFTRVGGATRVETALAVARFWPRPSHVVTVVWNKPGTKANDRLVWRAALCAARLNAPLLFRGSALSVAQKRKVKRTIAALEKARPPGGKGTFEVPAGKAKACRGDARPEGVAVWDARQDPPRSFRSIEPDTTLASRAVIAALRSSRAQPDVAIGLALAAHISVRDRAKVSLLIVPRTPQASPRAEARLRRQGALVQDGIVLGQTGILSDDSRTLLRQIIAARDHTSWFDAMIGVVDKLGLFVAAVLGLLVVAAAAPLAKRAVKAAGDRVPEVIERFRKEKTMNDQPPPLLAGFDGTVTIWLHSGQSVCGRPTHDDENGVRLEADKPTTGEAAFVIVPRGSILMIESTAADDGSPTRRSSRFLVAEYLEHITGRQPPVTEDGLTKAIDDAKTSPTWTSAPPSPVELDGLVDEAGSASDGELYAALRGLRDALRRVRGKVGAPDPELAGFLDSLRDVARVAERPTVHRPLMSGPPRVAGERPRVRLHK